MRTDPTVLRFSKMIVLFVLEFLRKLMRPAVERECDRQFHTAPTIGPTQTATVAVNLYFVRLFVSCETFFFLHSKRT